MRKEIIFIEKTDGYKHIIEAHCNGKKVAEYITTSSAIDDGSMEVLEHTLPWSVALWIQSIGMTNNGWYQVKGNRLIHREIDRYTGEERGYKIADLY